MAAEGSTGAFARADRLLDSRDFRRVLRRGKRRADRDVVVVACARPDSQRGSSPDPRSERAAPAAHPSGTRLGITASRKVGNAVVRNRFKRRVREWFRENRGFLDPNTDFVVIARRSGARLELAELAARLRDLLAIDRETAATTPGDN